MSEERVPRSSKSQVSCALGPQLLYSNWMPLRPKVWWVKPMFPSISTWGKKAERFEPTTAAAARASDQVARVAGLVRRAKPIN